VRQLVKISIILGFVKSNPDPGRLISEVAADTKYSPESIKSITNSNSEANKSLPSGGSKDIETAKYPKNGPYPYSYFSNSDGALDSKLLSFIKNPNNLLA